MCMRLSSWTLALFPWHTQDVKNRLLMTHLSKEACMAVDQFTSGALKHNNMRP